MDSTPVQRIISDSIREGLEAKRLLAEQSGVIERISGKFIETLQSGGTIFVLGNGGSAADAQHIAAELIGRFEAERPSLPAVALTVNTSNLTALANDYGYEQVFARQVEGLARRGDLVVGISTSGNSPSVLRAVEAARRKGCFTIGWTGRDGGKLKNAVDLCFQAPSAKTSRIQEIHIFVGHVVCRIVELAFSGIPAASEG